MYHLRVGVSENYLVVLTAIGHREPDITEDISVNSDLPVWLDKAGDDPQIVDAVYGESMTEFSDYYCQEIYPEDQDT